LGIGFHVGSFRSLAFTPRSSARDTGAGIGGIADPLRQSTESLEAGPKEPAPRRAACSAEYPHGIGDVTDSRRGGSGSDSTHFNWRCSMDDVLARAQARVTKDVGRELAGARWAIGIRGLFAIAFGAVILIWPGISLLSLTLVFGAFSLFYGVVTLGSVFSASTWQSRLWLLLLAAVDIGVGIAVIAWPDVSALALLYVIGAYAIAIGVLVLSGPFWIPGMSGGDVVLLVLSGLVSILFGVVMFSRPGDGALVLLALIAAFSIVSGVMMLAFAVSADPERLLNPSGGKRRQTADAHA
jgi:uncharacterized membrane protein HdeD (DUF308 family)